MDTPVLDLIILDTHDSHTLAVGDSSIYPTSFNIVSPTLEIKVPGYPQVSIAFTPKSVQLYTAESLGITCGSEGCAEDLPDGLYKFTYTIYPAFTYKVEKYYLKVDDLYARFDRAYLKLDILQCDKEVKYQDHKLLDEIEFYIQGAIAAANQCAQKLAIDLYNKASKLIDAFLEARCY